jgi:hypothetical protein
MFNFEKAIQSHLANEIEEGKDINESSKRY